MRPPPREGRKWCCSRRDEPGGVVAGGKAPHRQTDPHAHPPGGWKWADGPRQCNGACPPWGWGPDSQVKDE